MTTAPVQTVQQYMNCLTPYMPIMRCTVERLLADCPPQNEANLRCALAKLGITVPTTAIDTDRAFAIALCAEAGIEPTGQHQNWMVAVNALDSGEGSDAKGLQLLLDMMNANYSGPVSIHEGWGGTEADSNQDLITEKILFDIREAPEDSRHFVYAPLRAAAELGWITPEVFEAYAE